MTAVEKATSAGHSQELLSYDDATIIRAGLHVVSRCRVADHLAAGPLDIAQLSRLVGANSNALGRIMTMLASRGIFARTGTSIFGLTDLGRHLVSDSAGSLVDHFASIGPYHFTPYLFDAVVTGSSAVEHASGLSFWDYLQERPDELAMFHRKMAAQLLVEGFDWLQEHDWAPRGSASSVVDVAGGTGVVISSIVQRNPDVCGVLFERPEVIEEASKQAWCAVPTKRLSFMSGDMFADVPRGADVYLTVRTLHDWGDAQATEILANIRNGGRRDSILRLVERVVPEEFPASGDRGWARDVAMMILFGEGGERSGPRIEQLLESAGWKQTTMRPGPAGHSVIDAIMA